MPFLSFRLPLWQATALIGGTLLFSASLLAVAFATPQPDAGSPQQVAETLDSIIQPRFQKNAGRFGMSRTVQFDGHEAVTWREADSHAEKRSFASVKASRRPYIVAILHCRHKPGAHVDPPTKPQALDNFQSYTETVMAVGTTQASSNKMVGWAEKSLNAESSRT